MDTFEPSPLRTLPLAVRFAAKITRDRTVSGTVTVNTSIVQYFNRDNVLMGMS
jgi:hypothetical protein